MHDGHTLASCGDCVSFVSVFPETPGMEDWGYCRAQQAEIPRGRLAALRDAWLAGNRDALRTNPLGIYRTEEDDCCDAFRDREW